MRKVTRNLSLPKIKTNYNSIKANIKTISNTKRSKHIINKNPFNNLLIYIRFTPLFDNEELLTTEAVFSGQYSILTSREDDIAENIFHKFIKKNPSTIEKLEEMLEVINIDSLKEIRVQCGVYHIVREMIWNNG